MCFFYLLFERFQFLLIQMAAVEHPATDVGLCALDVGIGQPVIATVTVARSAAVLRIALIVTLLS